jgi:hypothetical protein
MCTRNLFRTFALGLTLSLGAAPSVVGQDHQHGAAVPAAQQAPADQHQHDTPAEQQEHAQHAVDAGMFPAREASGTAWLPDATPMYALHLRAGSWELMGHGNGFLQFLHEAAEGPRGSSQGGSINWVMGMARRTVGAGRFGIRSMLSVEPWTIPGCGYPDLLATGEVCDGEAIHDRQHPHDLFMELAADYERPLRGNIRWQVYAGLAGEPALGPVAYPHRLSAMPNPLAPIGHHWLDATHITFGVVTGGVFSRRWKAEASVFNGREPDEDRWDFDLAQPDSFSGRVWLAPTSTLALQVSAGHLNEAEAGHEGGPRVDVDRVTASATYHRPLRANSIWATTVGWGRNEEEGEATHSLLLETNVTLDDRDTWFGRFEIGGKPAHDLDVHGTDEVFTAAKLQAGYTRYLQARRGLASGVGGAVSASFVPSALKPYYGSRVNMGFGIYVTLRPGSHQM